jgi:hypothetical protein
VEWERVVRLTTYGFVLVVSIWAEAAFALAPLEKVRPVLAPADAAGQYEAWQKSKGQENTLACDPLWGNDALLCFRLWEGKRRRWVTHQDMKEWGVTIHEMKAYISDKASEHVKGLSQKTPIGLPGQYYELVDGDGWSAAAALRPDLVCDQLGVTHLLMAAPNESVVFAWVPGKAELDSAIGIAVKDSFDEGKGAITPVVYYWKSGVWTAYGEAKPRKR